MKKTIRIHANILFALLITHVILIPETYAIQAKHIATGARGITTDNTRMADGDSIAHEEIFADWETFPEYPGGSEAMKEYIYSNRQYPQEAMDRGIEGRVIVQFTVDSTGNICKERVVKSIDPQLDGEAIRLIRNMPRWKPGAFRGRPWNVRYTLPVSFVLPDSITQKVTESHKPKGPTIEEAKKKPLIVLIFADGAEIIAEGKQLNYLPLAVIEFDYLKPFGLSLDDIADTDTLVHYVARDEYGELGRDGAIVYHVKGKSYDEVTETLRQHWFHKGSTERLRTIDNKPGNADAEVVEYESELEGAFVTYEQQPEFPGGVKALMEHIKANTRYPQEAKSRGIQGRVIVRFIVEEDGTLTGEQVLEPVDPQLDAEAIRIARSMPKWRPGRLAGKPIRTRFSFPVTFRLKE